MIRILNIAAVSCLLSSSCFAGWVSSGGESFRSEKNPWFLKNTDVVNYCVLIDQSTVSAQPAEIRNAIASGFAYWKSELTMKEYPKGFTPVATQKFVEQGSCDDTTDIQFKIGYGTLTPEEISKGLPDPTLFVGVGIRKEYDEVGLRGKGTVYISSDIGPHAYRNSGNLVTQAWSKPKLLQYALLHEIGHIMGLPHLGVGIMSETFLTNILNISGWTFYADQPILSFTQPLRVAEICLPDLNDIFDPAFFGLDPTQKCLRLERSSQSDDTWTVSSRTAKGAPLKDVGLIKLTNMSSSPLSQKPVIFVYLPDTQKVFAQSELGFADFLVGALTSAGIYQAIFTPTGSHKPTHLQVNVDPESVVISGIVNGHIGPVFNHAIPALKGIAFP